MASSDGDAVLDEIGLTLDDAGGSALRVFERVLGISPSEGEELPPGWAAVALRASAMFGQSEEGELSLSVQQFAEMLRRAFARATGGDEGLCEFAAMESRVRVGWEAVARHMANVFNFEPSEARRLASHEERITQWGLDRIAGK